MKIIEPRPKARQPFKTRKEVVGQVNKIMDLIEKGDFEKAEYEAGVFYRRMNMMLEPIKIRKLKIKILRT